MRTGQILAVAVSALMGMASLARAAETYKVDPVHSSCLFRAKHFNAGYFYGRFNEITGTIVVDEANPAKSSAEIQVKVESIDTNDAKRDQHLKSPDFFNAKQFPTITFKSKQVKKSGKDTYEMTGDLNLHGVTRSVTAKVTRTGEGKDPFGKFRIGFETVFTIKRSDFGMKFMLGPISDEIQLIISVEGLRQ
jgi:polyisoprenoid-binding protein YceI